MSGIWVKFYPTDWLTGVMYLSALERGVYITLLAMMYDAEGPIADDPKRLAKACGCTAGAYAVAMRSLMAEGKIQSENGVLFNEKAREILLDRSTRVSSAKNAAETRHSRKAEGKQEANGTVAMRGTIRPHQPRNAVAMRADTEAEAEADTDVRRTVRNSTTSPDSLEQHLAEPSRAPLEKLEEDLRGAADWHHNEPRLAITAPIQALIDQGADLNLDVIPVVRALSSKVKARRGWSYFVEPIREAWQARLKAAPTAAQPSSAPQRPRVAVLVDTPQWEAWTQCMRAGGQRMSTPMDIYDDRGRRIGRGWYFDSEWPPGQQEVA